MKLTSKDYKILKTKIYLKSEFFAFYNGIHQNSTEWSKTEQELKKKKIIYYKICNQTTKTLSKQSIYKTTNFLLNGLTFFFKPYQVFHIKSLNQLSLFKLLAIKINKNILSFNQIKQSYSFNYYSNALLLYQFKLVNVKIYLRNNSEKIKFFSK